MCKTCFICVTKKGPSDEGDGLMNVYNVGLNSERDEINILGSFLVSSTGIRYLLVIVDCFTK